MSFFSYFDKLEEDFEQRPLKERAEIIENMKTARYVSNVVLTITIGIIIIKAFKK